MLPDDKSQQRVHKLFSELEKIAKEPPPAIGESGIEKDEIIGEIKAELPAERSRAEMEEQVRQPQAAPEQAEEQGRQTQSALTKVFSRVMDNPIITKELKRRMRGRNGFILIVVYLSLISLFIFLIYLLLTMESSVSNSDPSFLQTLGKIIFSTVVLLELLMLGFIGPALTSGAISSEREHKTIDLLKTSLLSARAIVLGKLSSAATFLLLLVFTAIPLQSLAFFLGGVGMAEILISTLMLVVTAIFFCALGLFFSSFLQRTLFATVYSYSSILISFILFLLFLFSISIISTYSNSSPTLLENILTIAIWFLFSTNPFFAAIVSEALLIEDQTLYLTSNIFFFGNNTLTLPMPWIIYVVFYILLTILLIMLSIYFVNRPDR